MKYLKQYNERFHVNNDVKHLTSIIYNKIYQLIPNLILKKEIVIENLLQDNYTRIKFQNDKIRVKLGERHAAINNISIINDCIIDLNLEITIKLSKSEMINKRLEVGKIREDINHECQHIIEYYHSDGNLSKSWSFHKRLKEHETRQHNQVWLDLCHLFYLGEEHELRSRVSQSLELIKNGEDLHNSELYKNIVNLSKLSADKIIAKMETYDDFGIIIYDFVTNVLLRKGKHLDVFRSYVSNLNKVGEVYKKKLNKVLYTYNNPNSYFEENIYKKIDFTEYVNDPISDKRDSLINRLLGDN